MTMTSSGQLGWTTKRLLISKSRLKCSRKSAPRKGTDTGASWKFQVYTLELEPQEKRKGKMQEPLQNIGEPSAVRRQTPSADKDLGLGNTDTEAPELTKTSRSERISFRKMRDELQNSSGAEATEGEPAGWMGVSTRQSASFSTWNKVFCSLEPSHHVSYETSRLQEVLESGMMELGSEKAWREGSSWRVEDSFES